MQRSHRFSLMLAICVVAFAAFAIVAHAADEDPVTVSGILKAAGCPLTDTQQKTIDGIEPGGGREARTALNDLFTDEQNTALIGKLGEQSFGGMRGGGMGGQGAPAGGQGGNRPPRIRNLFQIVILEKEGCPMTEGQIEAMSNIEPGPEMFQAQQEIYTDKQSEAMQEYMGGMRGGMPGGGGGFGGGGMR